jgi:hypothetical protein
MVQFYRAVFLDPNTGKIRGWVDPLDYAKEQTVMGHSQTRTFVSAVEILLASSSLVRGCRLVWAGDYYEQEMGSPDNLYKLCRPEAKICPEEADTTAYNYIVNHTKREFVSKDRTEKYTNLHPLPLLTAEGHGYTAGDYPHDHAAVGHWARDEITVTKKRPDGYVEIIFDLA